jgi:hypothetical protein
MTRIVALFVSSVCLLANVVHASGQVIVVDDTAGVGVDATTLQAAIDLAGEGDVILIKAGTYPHAASILNKSLTLVADDGSDVMLTLPMTISSLGAGKQVALRGLKFQLSQAGTPLTLVNCVGPIWAEDCEFISCCGLDILFPGHGVSVSGSSSVVFSRCLFQGGYNPLLTSADAGFASTNSTVSFYDCTLDGGDSSTATNSGGPGARLKGGNAFGSGTVFRGGSGGPPDGLFVCAGSGGDGVVLSAGTGAPNLNTLDCSFVGGPGGPSSAFCPAGAPGLPVKLTAGTHNVLPGTAHEFHVTPTAREGQSITKTYTGPPGEYVFRNYSGFQGSTYFADFRGVLALSLFAPINTKLEGILPAGGQLVDTSTIGPLSAGTEGVTLYLQAAFYNLSTGICLGTPSATVLLDSAF